MGAGDTDHHWGCLSYPSIVMAKHGDQARLQAEVAMDVLAPVYTRPSGGEAGGTEAECSCAQPVEWKVFAWR